MADAHMPEEFYELAVPFLPVEEEPGREGGRPRTDHRTVLKVIWFVLVVGCRWRDVPKELGCCGETARLRLRTWEEAGIWDGIHRLMLALLNKEHRLKLDTAIIDSTQVRAVGGGEETGPSPVDRRKKGTKYTLLVDRKGTPLAIHVAPANTSDHCEILPTVADFPEIGGRPGRPRNHPDDLYADAGYDSEATRSILRFLGIEPHIRYRQGAHGSHLGRIRWVVERTISWIKGFKRMRTRYDRDGVMVDAWSTLAVAVICFRVLMERCPS